MNHLYADSSKVRILGGIYINIFPMELSQSKINVYTAPFGALPRFNEIHKIIHDQNLIADVYRYKNEVFLYGKDLHKIIDYLKLEKITKKEIDLYNYPDFCKRLITYSYSNYLRSKNFEEVNKLVRSEFYEHEPYAISKNFNLKVYRGYRLKTIYFYNQNNETPIFALVVDLCWTVKDDNNKNISMTEISRKYNAVMEISQIQGELLPNNKINPEFSRILFQDHILPFVSSHNKFKLIVEEDIEVTIKETPIRVIIGSEVE
jgi:hypothetical protein